ncbi:MAG: hypothetical protein R8G66_07225 [Cytophagales bacterium]|nr:hypothetical protein [Cytophagales bacterium]
MSNRILLITAAVLVFYITAAFVELRLRGDYGHKETKTEKQVIPDFKHLSFEGIDQHVNIHHSDTASFELNAERAYSFEAIEYEMKGDTLVLIDLGSANDEQQSFVINTGPAFTSITSVESRYTIRDLRLDSLVINQRGGRGALSDCPRVGHLDLQATWDAEFDVFETPFESVNLEINQSNVELRSEVRSLTGQMSDRSYLSLHEVKNFQFQKDETSNLRMY